MHGPKGTFEVKGVPEELCEEFSKRREAIEAAMAAEGAEGAERAAYFTLTTREKKEHVAREILFQSWRELGDAFGFDPESVLNQVKAQEAKKAEIESTVQKAVEKITEGKAYFTEKELIRRTAELAPGNGISATAVISATREYLEKESIHLGRIGAEQYFTTKEIDALEKQMLAQVEASKMTHTEPVKGETVALPQTLNEEQKKALFQITQAPGGIQVVSGMAGTGKTTLLNTAREVWEAQGLEVKGAALAAVAAKGLEEGAEIKSATIAKTLLDLENGRLSFSTKTVLVLDEAGMIGTRQMARLVDEISKSGGKLILVGDERQLQPIEHGAPFKAIGERFGRSELKDIRRQEDEWARTAVKDFAEGRAEKGLRAFAERGLLNVAETKREAMNSLIRDWSSESRRYEEILILAGTRAEVKALNRMAQEARLQKGELTDRMLELNGSLFFENDRVVFTKNKKMYGVNNGDLGSTLAIQAA